uniref:peptidyl-tRNA hydrolase n=1 Tax=Glossina austeni TaxID=7395 RepID=A0A1A9VK44_GLOAU
MLIKPYSFMNNSGIPVAKIRNFYKLSLDNIIVIHDDADLELGRIKIKKGGSSAGHNGLKSIDSFIGNDYWRLRFGVEFNIAELRNNSSANTESKIPLIFIVMCLLPAQSSTFLQPKEEISFTSSLLLRKFSYQLNSTTIMIIMIMKNYRMSGAMGFDIVYVMPPAISADTTEAATINRADNPEAILRAAPTANIAARLAQATFGENSMAIKLIDCLVHHA